MEIFKINKRLDRSAANLLFECIENIILSLNSNFEVHHIGSSAIPGSLTKGDVDVNVRVEKDQFESIVKLFSKSFDVAQSENWNDTYASFTGRCLDKNIGIQLTIKNSTEDQFIRFRNIMNENYILVQDYNNLKLSFNNQSMKKYRKAKEAFIVSVLKRY